MLAKTRCERKLNIADKSARASFSMLGSVQKRLRGIKVDELFSTLQPVFLRKYILGFISCDTKATDKF